MLWEGHALQRICSGKGMLWEGHALQRTCSAKDMLYREYSSAGQFKGGAQGRNRRKKAAQSWRRVIPKEGERGGDMKIIMLGAPGAGKGTQAKKIAAKYELPHISTGDIFRANIKQGTKLGLEAKSYMDKGALVPDELTVKILLDRVSQEDCRKGYVLDGFPRTIPQAQVLEEALRDRGEEVDMAIDVHVPDEVIIARMGGRRACLQCGATYHVDHIPPAKEGVCDVCASSLVLRDDDAPATVSKRLEVYHAQTQPLIDFYTEREKLERVDGTLSTEEVFTSITQLLERE